MWTKKHGSTRGVIYQSVLCDALRSVGPEVEAGKGPRAGEWA